MKKEVMDLLELIKANPELEIIPMVDFEVVCDDSHSYWMGGWGKAEIAEIDEYYIDDERVYLKSTDFDDLADELWDVMDDVCAERKEAISKAEALPWKRAIIVNIGLPDK